MRAGSKFALALTAKGQVLAWGANGTGQLGTGTTTSTDIPVSLVLPLHRVAAIIGAGPVSRTSLAVLNPHLTPWWGNERRSRAGIFMIVTFHPVVSR